MNTPSMCQNSVSISSAPEEFDHRMGHMLYQAATIGAILLFLLSFWSC